MALRGAQEFLRTQKKKPAWNHPHYWAGWLLWGRSE